MDLNSLASLAVMCQGKQQINVLEFYEISYTGWSGLAAYQKHSHALILCHSVASETRRVCLEVGGCVWGVCMKKCCGSRPIGSQGNAVVHGDGVAKRDFADLARVDEARRAVGHAHDEPVAEKTT